MNNENNTKKGIPQELPEELLADIAGGGGKYSDKGYKVLDGYYGICEKYQYRYAPEEWENEYSDDCLRCRYFRREATYYPTLYCTYPDDYTER